METGSFAAVIVDSLELEIGVTVALLIGVALGPDKNSSVLQVVVGISKAIGAQAEKVGDVGGKLFDVVNDNERCHV